SGWGLEDARVVCRQLAFNPDETLVLTYDDLTSNKKNPPVYGNGREAGYIFRNVQCNGTEDNISSCSMDISKRCRKRNDAVATCKTIIRLRDGTNTSGRLEVYKNKRWLSVCYSSTLGPKAAEHFCSLLGVKPVNPIIIGDAYFGKNKQDTWWIHWPCIFGYCNLDIWWLPKCKRGKYASIKCQNNNSRDNPPEIMLAGINNYSGILIMKKFGVWGGIALRQPQSDENVILNNASDVVCHKLGYGTTDAMSIPIDHTHIPISTITWMFDVYCTGDEDTIFNCDHTKWGEPYIYDRQPSMVFITCRLPLRLVEQVSDSKTGQLEVLVNERWTSVCLKEWETGTLRVACKGLGMESRYAKAIQTSTDMVNHDWFQVGRCLGNEDSLAKCISTRPRCHDKEKMLLLSCPDKPESKINIHLDNHNETGDMFVNLNGVSFPMCNPNWNGGAARVACRQMGYNPDHAEHFRTDIKVNRVLLTDMTCHGNETNLSECNFSEWKVISFEHDSEHMNCQRNGGVFMSCADDSMKARLVGGPDEYSGHAQIWHEGKWKRVCFRKGDGSKEIVAETICRKLKRPGQYARDHPYSGYFGGGTSKPGIELNCNHRYPSLHLCHIHDNNCTHDLHYDLGVSCFEHNPDFHEYLQPTLTGYTIDNGLVLVKSHDTNKQPLTICGEKWTRNEAKVVCRQMGYNEDAVNDAAVDKFPMLQCLGGDKIVLSDVNCTGDEMSLAHCTFKHGDNVTCSSGLRAAVFCRKLSLKLTKTDKTNSSGLVTLDHLLISDHVSNEPNKHPICASGWDERDARVVCRQLGLPYHNASVYISTQGNLTHEYKPWITNVDCIGNEAHIGQCDFDNDFTVASDGIYDNVDYCTQYELTAHYVEHTYNYNFCDGNSYAGVVCK
ncbi:unnamed protein product, partial [Owenia fusiformis]